MLVALHLRPEDAVTYFNGSDASIIPSLHGGPSNRLWQLLQKA
jgi:hypothetical protein